MRIKKARMEEIGKDIAAHFDRTTVRLCRIASWYLHVETDHGKTTRIGQYALSKFPEVYTYHACHIFRRATLSIYFKRGTT